MISGNTKQNVLQQDSIIVEPKVKDFQDNDSLKINVARPKVLAIPETPKRFLTPPRKIIEAPRKIFNATTKDSIEFNLIVRSKEDLGKIQNNLVKDFLHPIAPNYEQWLGEFAVVAPDTVRNNEQLINSVIPDSSQLSDHQVNDSLVATETYLVGEDSLINNYTDSLKVDSTTKLRTETISTGEKNGTSESFIKNSDRDILSGLIILSVAIVGLLRMTNYKYLREIFSSVAFGQNARKMLKTVNLRNKKHAVILNLLFLFNSSIFVYQFISYYRVDTIFGNSLLTIPITMVVLLVFGMIKSVLFKFVAFVFEKENETNEYLFFTFLHNKVFSLVILPIVLIVPYIDVEVLPILFKIGLGLFVFLYLLQIFRGVKIILNNVASLFYLFLYLCALEILPLVIIYKLLIK